MGRRARPPLSTLSDGGRLVLPPDVELVPVAGLPLSVRQTLGCDAESWVITRRVSRAPTTILGAQAAALVALFREPRTVADVVAERARATGAEPARLLAAAASILAGLVHGHLLVDPDSPLVRALAPSLPMGTRVRGFRVVRSLRALADSEVYEVRSPSHGRAVLKIARAPDASTFGAAVEREAVLLTSLGAGTVTPPLIGTGRRAGRPFLIAGWRNGRPVTDAAARLRLLPAPWRERALLALAVAVLDAYAALHARGIVHGDVHPANVLADDEGVVSVLDLGQAASASVRGVVPSRGGVIYYFEPELAAAESSVIPPASSAGEQYALAVLLYRIFTGHDYLRFAATRAAALRQIVAESPVPFTRYGVPAWPALERALGRALSKHPEDRFPSVADFARRLRTIAPPACAPRRGLVDSARLRDRLLPRRPPGANGADGRTSPSDQDTAGTACALLHIAVAEDDAASLALADAWAAAATARTIARGGSDSTHLLQARVARARADGSQLAAAAEQFLAATALSARMLLGCAVLLDLGTLSHELEGRLVARGEALADAVEGDRRMRGDRPTPGAREVGWLYASLRWTRVAGRPMRERALARLHALATSTARGSDGWWTSPAGLAHVWTEAAEVLGEQRWMVLARGAAEDAWRGSDASIALASGLAGGAYALLRVYRHTGEIVWRRRAESLAARALRRAKVSRAVDAGLLHGALGVLVLDAELQRPEWARLPTIESPGRL